MLALVGVGEMGTQEPSKTLMPTEVVFRQADALRAEIEYDKIIPLMQNLLERRDLSQADILAALGRLAGAYFIIGKTETAKQAYLRILKVDPNYVLVKGSAPKEVKFFGKVKREYTQFQAQQDQRRRDQQLKESGIVGVLEQPQIRGEPIPFRYRLNDPFNLMTTFQVHYRKAGEINNYSLPLKPSSEGFWLGSIPGEWSAAERDYRLEYFLLTHDVAGEALLAQGSATHPLMVSVVKGASRGQSFYKSTWFWLGVGAALIGTGSFVYTQFYSLPDSDLGKIKVGS